MASTIFSGSSRFSDDFASIIERSLAIASLPLTQLGNERGKLTDETAALAGISGQVTSLRSAVEAVDEAKSALTFSISNAAIVNASVGSSALPGTYGIEVVSVGSRSNTASKDTLPQVSNPSSASISTAGSFTLTVDGVSHTITPAANTLDSLAAAINADTSTGVQAVILNLGSSSSPDYRLSVQSSKLGPVPIQLTEIDADPEDLLTEISAGTLATYRINGQPVATPLTSDSATGVTVAPGLTIDFLKVGQADVEVKKDVNKLTGALSSLAAAYNAAMTEIDKHRGENGGVLAGQSIITGLSQSLRGLFAHQNSGAIKNAAGIGLTFSDKGILSFNASEFNEKALADALEFIGGAAGAGLLGTAEDVLDGFDDVSNGILPVASKSITDQIAATDKLITANQERINLLQTRLASQMAAADALIGQMEQQIGYMNGLFEAMKANAQSY